MKRSASAFASVFLFVAASPVAVGQSYDFAPLDRFLADVEGQLRSGFEVLMIQDGREIYWKQFGPWPKDRQASIASATKWLSGAVIMSLVDDGTLSLDDKASRYLPYLTGEKESITVRQLMSHTSGYGREFPLVHPCIADSSDTLDSCTQALAAVPLEAAPGTAFIYSGAGMQVAGRVGEVASGKDWHTLFRERIAEPLGMTSTDYEYEGPTRNPRISGGGRSTASDYMNFLTMLQQRGVYEGRRVLSSRAVDIMLGDQTGDARITYTPSPDTWRYGIGNWLEDPDANRQTMQNSSTGLAGWTPMIDRSRNLQVVIGMQNAIRPFQPHYAEFRQILRRIIPPATLTPLGVTNGASYEAGPVAPGALVALFGMQLGPATGASAQIGNGAAPTTLGGTTVTIDGITAPLLYASSSQVVAIVPFEIAGKNTMGVQVSYNGTKSSAVTVPVSSAFPALFAADSSGRGPAAALNEDSTINGPSNLAARGSVVQLFGTGAGRTDPPGQTGAVQFDAGRILEPVRVFIGGVRAEVLYAGPAPGLISGCFQINARVPETVTAGPALPVVVQAGSEVSPAAVTIAVR